MINKGIYAATLSVINKDYSLNVEETINHAEKIILNGCHGVFFLAQLGKVNLFQYQKKKSLFHQ